jgi:hypothetical protein
MNAIHPKRLLCVDVGGTRIKWCSLTTPITYADLRDTLPSSKESLGLLNDRLPDFLISEMGDSSEHDGIAVCLPGEILDAGERVKSWLNHNGLPEDLKKRLEQATGRPAWLINDALAWLEGAARVCELNGFDFDYPAFVCTLGTGAGLARLDSRQEFMALEISDWFRGTRTAEAAGWDAGILAQEPWRIHEIIGEPFFTWVEKENAQWSESEIETQFSRRVAAFIRDACVDYQGTPAKTVFVAGGNSSYVRPQVIEKRCNLRVIHLEHQFPDFSHDLIPLLGCLPEY